MPNSKQVLKRLLSLTYSDECEASDHACTLVYSDVQKFLKRLRRSGYSVRYIVAGEYGSNKGRAHWHIILFFDGAAPDVELDVRFDWKFWPHGFSYFQRPDYRGFRYVLKYALKDQDLQVSIGHLGMSKRPPLGEKYFQQLAQHYVDAALAPQSYSYAIDGQEFWMQGKTRENFILTFLRLWEEQRADPVPLSYDAIDPVLDRIAREEADLDGEVLQRFSVAKYAHCSFFFPADVPASRRFLSELDCDKIYGEVQTRSGHTKNVVLFEWSDGALTYLTETTQWHEVNPRKAAAWLDRVNILEHQPLGATLRPYPMAAHVKIN